MMPAWGWVALAFAVLCLAGFAGVLLGLLSRIRHLERRLRMQRKQLVRLRGWKEAADDTIGRVEDELRACQQQNRRLRKARRTAAETVRSGGSARDLRESGLPAVVLQAIAQAPVQGVHRQRLMDFAETELLAGGWEGGAGDGDEEVAKGVAQKIVGGIDGPEVDDEFDAG